MQAYYQMRASEGLLGGALPAGEYAWTMDFRCPTPEECREAFGVRLLHEGEESFTFVAHLISDGTRMTYRGASVRRAASGAAGLPGCGGVSAPGAASVCVTAESGEAYVLAATSYPLAALAGEPLLWLKAPGLNGYAADGEELAGVCACGAEGLATPTPALPGTATADVMATSGTLPPGVALTVQLVKLN